MLKIKTKGKVKLIVPKIVVVCGKMYSPRVVYSTFGSLLVLEPMISTDEVEREVKCPYAQTKLAGDETYEVCSINIKPCLLESGLTCDTYEEAMEELAKEAEEETNEEGIC